MASQHTCADRIVELKRKETNIGKEGKRNVKLVKESRLPDDV